MQSPRTKPDRAACRLGVGWEPQGREQVMEFWGEGKDTITQFFFFFKPGVQKFEGSPREFLKTLSLSTFKDYKSQFP